MTTSSAPAVRTDRPGTAARPALLAVAGGVLAAVVVWFLAVVLADVDLRVPMGAGEVEVGVGAVVVAAGVAGLLGWALLAVLTRTTRRPATIWRVAAVVVLLLSLGGPLSTGAGAPAAVLVALHVAVAAVLVPLLPRAVR